MEGMAKTAMVAITTIKTRKLVTYSHLCFISHSSPHDILKSCYPDNLLSVFRNAFRHRRLSSRKSRKTAGQSYYLKYVSSHHHYTPCLISWLDCARHNVRLAMIAWHLAQCQVTIEIATDGGCERMADWVDRLYNDFGKRGNDDESISKQWRTSAVGGL